MNVGDRVCFFRKQSILGVIVDVENSIDARGFRYRVQWDHMQPYEGRPAPRYVAEEIRLAPTCKSRWIGEWK